MYRTGVYPALQLCIRRHGVVVVNRALGHARGNAPSDAADAAKVPATTETPFNLFSATKAVTAMVIHKLDEQRVLHLEDRVCDFIPEFGRHGKHRITIRHILAHRAGIPNLPPEYLDLDLLTDPGRIVEVLCDARLRTRPGRLLAYHAVTGGFVLAEVVRRATGDDIRTVLEQRILEPLGLRWMRYGVHPRDLPLVARDAVTGPPVPPPFSWMLRNALGVELSHAVEICNDPRFLSAIVPSANGVSTAREAASFYQCLLEEGQLDGVRVFEPRTVRHATSEQSYWEVDLTLGIPIRYGLGFMLGSKRASLFGTDNAAAFGHVGFTNTFTWADPERQIAVGLLTNGKPVLSVHAVRLVQFMQEMNRAFPKVPPVGETRARRAA
jgi:CubicO group peptidase (beta-lactamase class C family)